MDHALLQEDHCLHHCIITIRSPRKSFITRIFLCPELSNYSLHTDYSCPELSNYRIVFTRSSTEHHGFIYLVPNYRIIEFLFTRIILVTNYRICELSFITRISTEHHGFIYLVTNYRICELSFITRISTEHHGFIYLVMNSIIR